MQLWNNRHQTNFHVCLFWKLDWSLKFFFFWNKNVMKLHNNVVLDENRKLWNIPKFIHAWKENISLWGINMFFAPFDIIRCNNKNAIVIIFTHIFYGGKAKHSIMVKIDPILDTFFKVLISQKLLLLHIYFKNQVK